MKSHEQFKKEFFKKFPDMEKLYLSEKRLVYLGVKIYQEREKMGISIEELVD